MAVLYMDGFDHYTTADTGVATTSPSLWTSPVANNGILTMPVLGGLGLRCRWQTSSNPSTAGFGGPRLASPKTVVSGDTMGYGFHFYMNSAPINITGGIIGWGPSSGDAQKTLGIASGVLHFRNGAANSTSLGNSGGNTLSTGVLYHIEVKILWHASAGTVEVRVNGAVYMSLTGIATLPATPTHIIFMGTNLAGTSSTDNTVNQLYDNFYVWDVSGAQNNNFLGERTVFTIFPNADTATADWTKSTGTDGFDLINDVPAVDATRYITSSTVGDDSIFEMASLPSSNVAINAIQTVIRGQKTDAAAGSIQFGPVSNGTQSLSSSHDMTQAQFQHFYKITELDPDGGITWTPSKVNASQSIVVRSA